MVFEAKGAAKIAVLARRLGVQSYDDPGDAVSFIDKNTDQWYRLEDILEAIVNRLV